jgi:thioredoxin 2
MEDAKGSQANVLVRCPFCSKLNRVDAARAKDRPSCGECNRPLLLDRPVPITDDDFERVVKESGIPVVVDFYADWCQPCKVMAPIFDEAARQRVGRVLFTKMNTDRHPQASVRYGIRGIPTFIVFRAGEEVARQVGAVPAPQLHQLLDRVSADA